VRIQGAGLVVVGLLTAAMAGCAALSGGARVRESSSGQIVVEAGGSQSFDELADQVYGDPKLGRAVAEASRLPYAEGVPRGALLVLPPREKLQDRVAVERYSEELFEAGLAAADAGAYREAAQSFRKSLEVTPGRPDVLYNLGLALLQAGEYEAAEKALRECLDERPDDPAVHYALGSLYRKRRAYRRALAEFDATLEEDRRHTKAAFARARTLADLGEISDAEQAYRQFMRDFPDDPWADRARQDLEDLQEGTADPGAPVEP
jgi:tetratricopeptide (TPR) repeat protein